MNKSTFLAAGGCLLSLALLAGCAAGGAGTAAGASTTAAATEAAQTFPAANEDPETLTGEITTIEGLEITLALAVLPEPPDGAGGAPGADGSTPPEKPDGAAGTAQASDGSTPPEKPDGAAGTAQASDRSTPPELPGGADGGRPYAATGETVVLTLTDATTILAGTETASLSDLAVGDLIRAAMDGERVASITKVQQAGAPGGAPGMQEGGSAVALTGAATVDGGVGSLTGELSSTAADENAVLVQNGGSAVIESAALSKTGDSSSADNSNFSGLNAILAVTAGSAASISDSTLTSDAEGANAVFSTGENAKITVRGVTITTSGNSSRGLDATYGGTIEATDVTITTTGAHCAPIATDRGEGTVTVTGGTLSASGDGSPCIYSTGSITVSDVTGTATGSQIAVVEGKNSITLKNADLTGAGLNGVMLYQSTSGDAAEGTAMLTVSDSTLTATSAGPMFYVTNTTAAAMLTHTALVFPGGILANVAGNSTNNWGTPGSNGGDFTLTAVAQTLTGDVTCDAISAVEIKLTEGSSWTGAINTENTAKLAVVSLDSTSVWTLTGDCYVGALTDADATCANILSGGYTIWYDAANSANAWLSGRTVALTGGGALRPIAG